MPVLRSLPLIVVVGLVWGIALLGFQPSGDGGEYLLMTHAIASHGTPDIRVSDAEWLGASEPRFRVFARELSRGLREREERPVAAVRQAEHGAYFSMHFWLYSLLAVPLLWLTEALGAEPSAALAVVNALAVSGAVVVLWRHFARGAFGIAAAVIFVVTGTTFYLGWTGPEALTGAAVVVACVAASRGELGLGCLCAAVAAAQNASALALVPYVIARCRFARAPLRRKDVLLSAVAAGVAVLPYAFFYAEFRSPSLLGRFATDPRLISLERAWSLLFDFNQGLLYGMPGVLCLSCAAVGFALLTADARARPVVARHVTLTVALVVIMAIPTLSVHNWNAGCSVVMRYGYWLALPLLVLGLELLASKANENRGAWLILGATFTLGLAVMAENGVAGERYRYLRHTRLATFVLRHAPGAYNPVPEIFSERTRGSEAPLRNSELTIWPRRGTPVKLLQPSDASEHSERLCPQGGNAESDQVHVVSDGWAYLDAPFRCVPSAP